MPLYRILVTLFALWECLRCSLTGQLGALRPRLGFHRPGSDHPHIWLHAASNGELASAKPVVERLRDLRPDLPLLITCNTESGVALARSWGLDGLTAHLAPLDLAWVSRGVHRRWQVAAHITMESELWPHRILSCPGPVVLLGARLTARTAKGWARFGGLARAILARVALLIAQDAGSAGRFVDLGLSPQHLGPVVDLKSFYARPDQTPSDALRAAFPRADTWLAASTHDGEDEIVLDAHLTARAADPALRLILAPRHPRRAEAIRALAVARGLTCALRSRDEPFATADVYIADTMGEMALWYALAGRVFVAGTLTDRGGHTPYEPAAFGAALIHGPDVRNFAAAFAQLDRAQAAVEISDAGELAQALSDLRAPKRMAEADARAKQALRQDADLDGVVERIASLLPPATLAILEPSSE
ncbi:3-deoxy-D-manno-octulosonic acid transferase [Aestuariicoccus sp. MJ-SS9]|uniref:3-deoxy-D-manno-octulosonic acid transferase n=1 Tax=Aestuariicoccus sp. MJ-SS9 TaxID=3079855 RepID=UPI002912DB88|nr:glycosyltransferase N-terminal domain-containing protein [Aestuariicoccus sp. MJ-SS9]MDU8910323.1 glycosyltransferase N-terminal domain-containing protein [Aestuariicoccus sp. MJ-SS9]